MSELFLPEPIERRAWSGLGWCGERVGRSQRYWPEGTRGGIWEWADPTMPGDFLDRIEGVALPALRALDTAERCIAHARTHGRNCAAGQDWWLAVEITSGDIAVARRRWATFGKGFPKDGVHAPRTWLFGEETFRRLCEVGEPLMAGDRAALAALLRHWEAENAASAGLAPDWEPLPLDRG